jgi:hypothetical protein
MSKHLNASSLFAMSPMLLLHVCCAAVGILDSCLGAQLPHRLCCADLSGALWVTKLRTRQAGRA